MLSLIRLDTTPPPLWTGHWGRTNPMAGTPFANADTSLQNTTGDDVVNEYNAQRVEGDLWRRDFVAEQNIKRLLDFLNTRTGILFNTPSVRLISGASLELGRIIPTSGLDGWYYVAAAIVVTSGSYTSGQARISLYNVTDAAVVESDLANTISFKAATMVDRGELLNPAKQYTFKLHNDSANTLIMSGWAMVQASPT